MSSPQDLITAFEAWMATGSPYADKHHLLNMAILRAGVPAVGTSTFPEGTNSVSLTVPTGELWQIQWVYAAATPSATAGNRNYQLSFGADAPPFPTGVNVVASTPTDLFWVAGIDSDVEISSANVFRAGIPPLLLPAGTVITVADTGQQDAGDALAGSIHYIKWSA